MKKLPKLKGRPCDLLETRGGMVTLRSKLVLRHRGETVALNFGSREEHNRGRGRKTNGGIY